MSHLKITLERSPIGFEKSQGQTARALGLTRRGMTVVRPDNDSIRGMVFKIKHMLSVEEVSGIEATAASNTVPAAATSSATTAGSAEG